MSGAWEPCGREQRRPLPWSQAACKPAGVAFALRSHSWMTTGPKSPSVMMR